MKKFDELKKVIGKAVNDFAPTGLATLFNKNILNHKKVDLEEYKKNRKQFKQDLKNDENNVKITERNAVVYTRELIKENEQQIRDLVNNRTMLDIDKRKQIMELQRLNNRLKKKVGKAKKSSDIFSNLGEAANVVGNIAHLAYDFYKQGGVEKVFSAKSKKEKRKALMKVNKDMDKFLKDNKKYLPSSVSMILKTVLSLTSVVLPLLDTLSTQAEKKKKLKIKK